MKVSKKQAKKAYKRCPRCDKSCLQSASVCEECGLIFSRLELATNKSAKALMKKGEREYIIYTADLPKDLSYTKLLLFTFLLGLVGGQYYYTGKYIKGFLMSAVFLLASLCVIFNSYLVDNLVNVAYIAVGLAVVAWMVSCVFVISHKFKVPVGIETTETGGFKV